MTPGPWIVATLRNQTLIMDAPGRWVAVLTTQIDAARLGTPIEPLWTMDPGDLRLIVAAPQLLEALKKSTVEHARLLARYPQEVGLEIFIQYNGDLVAAIEEGTS